MKTVRDILYETLEPYEEEFDGLSIRGYDQALKELESLILKEVIGEDKETDVLESMRDPETNGENYLRSEQRKKLKSIIGGK